MKIVWWNNTINLTPDPNSEKILSAKDWYSGRALETLIGVSRPAVPIYFGMTRLESSQFQLEELKRHFPTISKGTPGLYMKQIDEFVNLCSENDPNDVMIVTIDSGSLLVFSLIEDKWHQISDHPTASFPFRHGTDKDVNPKYYYVKLEVEIPLLNVPPVLTTIKRNPAVRNTPAIFALYPNSNSSRGDGSDDYRENVLALLSILAENGRDVEGMRQYIQETVAHPRYLIRCLSDTQLETLIAKVYESDGYHVSAYRGGTNVDIEYTIVANKHIDEYLLSTSTISNGAEKTKGVQVKRRISLNKIKNISADILVTGEIVPDGFVSDIEVIDGRRLLSMLRESETATSWLKRELAWLKSIGLTVEDFLNAPQL